MSSGKRCHSAHRWLAREGRSRDTTAAHEEVEWQLEAVDLALVENWLKEHPSAAEVAVVPEPASELSDIYYDTEDWRFYRAGYAMRVRRDSESAEATMKALVPSEGGLRRRREISEPIEGAKTLKGIPGSVNASEHSPAP